ncbi:hypothetical protein DAI22_06g051700 [Oryza sativa Japonica Group]|nr:hypothetical protein DAI22_06g051700 [Oryza sativa Japonica Group]
MILHEYGRINGDFSEDFATAKIQNCTLLTPTHSFRVQKQDVRVRLLLLCSFAGSTTAAAAFSPPIRTRRRRVGARHRRRRRIRGFVISSSASAPARRTDHPMETDTWRCSKWARKGGGGSRRASRSRRSSSSPAITRSPSPWRRRAGDGDGDGYGGGRGAGGDPTAVNTQARRPTVWMSVNSNLQSGPYFGSLPKYQLKRSWLFCTMVPVSRFCRCGPAAAVALDVFTF